MPAVGSSSTPKKLSMMAVSEKEMLLDWDVGVPSEETLVPGDKAAQQHEDQVNRGSLSHTVSSLCGVTLCSRDVMIHR